MRSSPMSAPDATVEPPDVDAFDADVLIYAAAPQHPVGVHVAAQFPDDADSTDIVGVGSVLLLPELLSKPTRVGDQAQLHTLGWFLSRLELLPVDEGGARLATSLAAAYRLRAADAVHLATAVHAGADRFITNNRKDFPTSIAEVDVCYPDQL